MSRRNPARGSGRYGTALIEEGGCEEMEVEVEELVTWCEEQKRLVDASAWAECVALEVARPRDTRSDEA